MNFTETSCSVCGIKFRLPCFLLERFELTGETHYCPFGHRQYYTGGWKDKAGEAGRFKDQWSAQREKRWALDAQVTSLKTQVRNLKAKNKGEKRPKPKGAK